MDHNDQYMTVDAPTHTFNAPTCAFNTPICAFNTHTCTFNAPMPSQLARARQMTTLPFPPLQQHPDCLCRNQINEHQVPKWRQVLFGPQVIYSLFFPPCKHTSRGNVVITLQISFIIHIVHFTNSSWDSLDRSFGETKPNRTSPIQFSCGPQLPTPGSKNQTELDLKTLFI
jgi:hypothetical protein